MENPEHRASGNLKKPSQATRKSESKSCSENGPRSKREKEMKNFQNLNNRLEQYIMGQRERQASEILLQQQIENLQKNSSKEVERVKDDFMGELDKVRNERNTAAAHVAQLEHEIVDFKRSDSKNEQEIHRLSAENKQNLKDILKKDEDYQTLLHKQHQTETKLNRSSEAYLRCKKELKDTNYELTSKTKEFSKKEEKLNKLLAREKAKNDDTGLANRRYEELFQRTSEDTANLKRQLGKQENALRKTFGKQLNDILHERQAQYETEKQKMMQDLKDSNREQIKALRDKLEDVSNENSQHLGEVEKLKSKLEEAKSQEKIASLKMAAVERRLDEQTVIPKREIASKNQIIKRLKDGLTRKEDEFNDLMDLKISLTNELKAYERMLDSEEERNKNSKKRKIAEVKESKTPQKNKTPQKISERKSFGAILDDEHKLKIIAVNVMKATITIKYSGCVALSLKGWRLTNKSGKRNFKFPENDKIEPGHTLNICSSGAPESQSLSQKDRTYVWNEEDFDVVHGDEAILISPTGAAISSADIPPSKAADSGCALM